MHTFRQKGFFETVGRYARWFRLFSHNIIKMVRNTFKQRFYLIIVLSGFLCGLPSCEWKGNKQPEETICLQGKIIATDTLYSRSFRPILSGNVLFTAQTSGQPCMYMGRVDGDSLKTIATFLEYGEGPDEFGYIDIACESDSTLIIFDSRGGRAISVCKVYYRDKMPTDNLRIEKYSLKGLDKLRAGGIAFVALSDSTILMNSTDYDSPGIFSVVDYKNQTIKNLSWMPDDGFGGDKRVSQSLYTENSQVFRIGERFLYVCGAGYYAFVFTLDNEGIKVEEALCEEYPEYSTSDDINYLVKRDRPQLSAAVSSRRIYLLDIAFDQDGNPASERHSPSVGNIVHCYDFLGNHLADYTLDRAGYSILVDREDNNLYLYSINDDTFDIDIVKYPIKKD